ncbi:MAG: lipopolysaccharide biosynthesis protein [Rhodothermales bacterium]|nr:lipopolysaccharide biosynthesis protein [Rhodothermales bacterium]
MNRRLLVNALVSAAQVVVVGGAFFVLYRFLLDVLGAADFGVWALVLATTSATAVANLGLAASAVKFVSQYRARGDTVYVAQLIQTAMLSVGGVLAVVLPLLYPALRALLGVFIEPASKLPEALSILPYALVSFWLTSVGGVALSCLDGFQRVDWRGGLLMGSTLTYLGLAFLLVPDGGLIGLAQAQVIQAALLFAAGWLLLRRLLPALPLVPWRWHRGAFREMLGYSLNFQVIAVFQMLFEPVTKALVSRFGGVDVLAYFEMAHRMVFQIRALFATAHQAIVPTIAEVQETAPERLRDLYAGSFRLLLYLLVPALPFFIALTPLISRVWIGRYEPAFVTFAVLLFAGWFLNLTSGPAYFANMGTGALRWNVIGHAVAGVLNAALGVALGWYAGGTGVVVGFMTAIVAGSLTTTLAYHRAHGIRMAGLVEPATLWLGAAGLAALGAALALYEWLRAAWPLAALALAVVAVFALVVALPLWRHPMRAVLQAWLARAFLRGRSAPVRR